MHALMPTAPKACRCQITWDTRFSQTSVLSPRFSLSSQAQGSHRKMVETPLNAVTICGATPEMIQEAIIKKLSSVLNISTVDIDPQRSISSNDVSGLVSWGLGSSYINRQRPIPWSLISLGTLGLPVVVSKAATIR
ncbi:hypothetical protein F4809DRAFT_611251 [Biscogniauxia mediterranea]|nr:hypothetical protein F4809DRAFT_611251 [Biscogniauxia mediterranea]